MNGDCEHGDDPLLCPPCQRAAGNLSPVSRPAPRRARPRPRLVRIVRRSGMARHDAWCGGCREDIRAGARITRVELSDGERYWWHRGCAERALEAAHGGKATT